MPKHFPIPVFAPSRTRSVAKRAAHIASLATLLAGCAVGPDFVPPQDPQQTGYTADPVNLKVSDAKEAEQHLALGKKVSGDWWELLHSPALTAVVRQAIADNNTLAAAKATLGQAQEAVSQAAGGYFPQLNLTGGVSRQKPNLEQQGIFSPRPIFNLYQIGMNLSYTLDIFGGTRRTVEKQEALAQYQDDQLNAAYLTLTGNAVNQAIQIASARAQIKAVEEIIADDERNVNSIKTQLGVHEATRIDLESAQSQLATDRTQLPPLRQQLSVAQHALAVLVGQAPADWHAPDFDLAGFTLPQEIPVSLPSTLVHQRPDVLASEAQLHAASAEIGVTTAQLYPNLTLSASFTQVALSTQPLFTLANSVWSIASSVTQPLFHGGTLLAEKRGAEDAFNGALANYRQTVLQSFGQVADSLKALEHDGQLVADQERALQSAQASAELTRTSYDAGNANVLQVLDAERLYAQAKLGYARATAQRFQDTAQLFLAMGGDWQSWRARLATSDTDPSPKRQGS